ncbi:hypothetical protein ACERIT_00300 [Halopenitus sp. H-Gu1]|uniref:EMC6-like membrane protein n=1 Tax=Halopenitus sp. H-Gu1 TaxID=3242697 RepID=UPI00359E8C87
MSDDSGITGHARSVVVTTIACLAGIGAALVSAWYVGTSPANGGSTMAVVVMGAFAVGQFPILKLVGVDITDFGMKDNLYVVFMTFTLWFITYTILLTSGVQL